MANKTAKHPVYPKELIYIGSAGGAPTPGAFYAAKRGDSLSSIARQAYGAASYWMLINRNPWNKATLTYRADSSKCSSPKASSAKAGVTRDPGGLGAFIALCERDAKVTGYPLPVIWIPSSTKVMPSSSVEDKPVFVREVTQSMLPHVSTGTPEQTMPELKQPILMPRPKPRLDEGVKDIEEPVAASMVPAGLDWWWYALGAAAIGAFVWKSKAKKKKR